MAWLGVALVTVSGAVGFDGTDRIEATMDDTPEAPRAQLNVGRIDVLHELSAPTRTAPLGLRKPGRLGGGRSCRGKPPGPDEA